MAHIAPIVVCVSPLPQFAPVVQRPRTPPFQGGNTGSNPVRGTMHIQVRFKYEDGDEGTIDPDHPRWDELENTITQEVRWATAECLDIDPPDVRIYHD
jgi:hypothetical protein